MINYRAITGFLVRIGIGALFTYFGLQAIITPEVAMSYLPSYVDFLANDAFMITYGIIQTIVGLSLILGLYVRYASLAAAAMLVGIIVSLGINEVAYRDAVILLSAVHLAFEPSYLWALKAR